MIITTYTCDKCHKSQENYKNMYDIHFYVKIHPLKESRLTPPQKSALWCENCCKEFRLIPLHQPAPMQQPTIEDILGEIDASR